MARGVNKVILIGSVGKDPELRYLSGGDAVVNFSMATNEEWKDKATGEKKERAEWHKIVAYKGLAEIIGKYVTKGSRIYIEGKLTTRKWQDSNGQDRYTTEIIANEMQMLGGGNQEPKPASEQQSAPQSGFDDFDDDFDDDLDSVPF